MTSVATFACRRCNTVLTADGAESGAGLLCAVCRMPYWPVKPAATAPEEQTLPLARNAFILALSSIIACPAGLPAALMGWLALRKIRQSGDRLAGKGFAQAAVAVGLVGGLGMPLFIGTFLLNIGKMNASTVKGTTPEVVAQVNATFGADPLPPWLIGAYAHYMPTQGMREVVFVDRMTPSTAHLVTPPRVQLVVMEMQQLFVGRNLLQAGLDRWPGNYQMQFASQTKTEESWGEDDDKKLAVTVETGIDPRDNRPQRQYTAITQRDQRWLGMRVLTQEADPADPQSHWLSAEEVQKIFLSYAFPQPPGSPAAAATSPPASRTTPSAPIPSAPTPSAPTPSAPTPSAPTPSAPIPTVPTPAPTP